MQFNARRFGVLVVLACGPGAVALGSQSEFIPMGFLPGGEVSSATAVSRDGQTVVGLSHEWNGDRTVYRGFRWNETEGMESLGAFRGSISRSAAWGVSDNGQWACGASAGGNQCATRFSDSLIEGIPKSYGVQTFESMAISGDGQTLVGYQGVSDALWKAFRWTPHTGTKSLESLDRHPLDMATAVSRDGSIVAGWSKYTVNFVGYSYAVWWDSTGEVHPIWSPSGMEFGSRAVDIDDDGRYVLCWGVSADGSRTVVFLHDRNSGTNRLIPTFSRTWFIPSGMCRSGGIVAGTDWSGTLGEARLSVFGRAPDSLHRLLTRTGSTAHLEWKLSEARAVTVADGRVVVVGHGTDPEGRIQSFIARIPLVRLMAPTSGP